MRRRDTLLQAGLAASGGILAWLGLSALEPALAGGLAANVILEEAAKILVLGAAIIIGRNGPRARALLLGLVSIAVFSAAENLAYFLAFGSPDVLSRLLWSQPVHLVSGLAWALALFSLLDGPSPRRLLPALAFGLLALAWHLGFNLLASGPLPQAGRPGHGAAMAAAGLANLLGLSALGRYFAQRVVIGGLLYGKR